MRRVVWLCKAYISDARLFKAFCLIALFCIVICFSTTPYPHSLVLVWQQDGGLDTSRITVTRAEELQGRLLEFWEGSDILKVDDERVREVCDDQDIVFKYKDPVKLMAKLLGNTDFNDDIVYSAEATW